MKKIWQAVIFLSIASAFSLLVDDTVHSFLALNHHPYLDVAMIFFSHLGGLAVGIPFLVIAVVLLENRKKDEVALNLLTAVIADIAIVSVIKIIVGRGRPEGRDIRMLEAYLSSFPSGHSSRAFAMFNVLKKYYNMPFLFYSLASLVAFSRIYFGVHYLSDVLAGAAVGLAVSEAVVEKNIGVRIKNAVFCVKTKPESILKAK